MPCTLWAVSSVVGCALTRLRSETLLHPAQSVDEARVRPCTLFARTSHMNGVQRGRDGVHFHSASPPYSSCVLLAFAAPRWNIVFVRGDARWTLQVKWVSERRPLLLRRATVCGKHPLHTAVPLASLHAAYSKKEGRAHSWRSRPDWLMPRLARCTARVTAKHA